MPLNIADLSITSPAFEPEGRIPTRHAGDGEDVSPPLLISGVPRGAQELALICHDPDAPLPRGFTHWVCSGISVDTSEIPEGGGAAFTEGVNDFGGTGYSGPMPPEGHGLHHYYFWVYALDSSLNAEPGLTRRDLLELMDGRILEQARLVGTYER